MYDGRCSAVPAKEAEERAASGEPHVIRLRVPRLGSMGTGQGSNDASPASLAGLDQPFAPRVPHSGLGVDVSEGQAALRASDTVLGTTRFPLVAVDDGVLLKSDGWPTYHLASVADDACMGISHVIRG